MKKLLSITLAVAMIMSLFCVVPASADVGAAPYFFYTFEDGERKINDMGGHSATIVDGGVNGSAKATQITVDNVARGSDLLAAKTLEVNANSVLKASMWMKLPAAQHADSAGIASLVLFGYESGNDETISKIDGKDYQFITANFNTQSTDWQKVTWEYTFKEDHIGDYAIKVQLRMNPNNGGNKSIDNTDPENPVASDNCTYLIDDLEMKIIKSPIKESTQDFTSASEGTNYPSWLTTGGRRYTHGVKTAPDDSSNKTLRLKVDTGYNYVNFKWLEDRTVVAGDKIKVSFDVYVSSTSFTDDDNKATVKFYPCNASGEEGKLTSSKSYSSTIDMTKVGEWQTVEFTFDINADGNLYQYYVQVEDSTKLESGTYAISETDMYFDNLKIEIDSASHAVPVVTEASATMAADTGVVTPTYTYAALKGNSLGADTSYFKLLDGDKVIASFAKSDSIVVPEANRASENLKLVVVPYSADGYFGNEVTVAIPAAVSITETAIEIDGSNIKVSAAADIRDAKLIFVAYDANGKMTASNSETSVTVAANATGSYPIPTGFTTGTVKVMLWQDMSNCVPLADCID